MRGADRGAWGLPAIASSTHAGDASGRVRPASREGASCGLAARFGRAPALSYIANVLSNPKFALSLTPTYGEFRIGHTRWVSNLGKVRGRPYPPFPCRITFALAESDRDLRSNDVDCDHQDRGGKQSKFDSSYACSAARQRNAIVVDRPLQPIALTGT